MKIKKEILRESMINCKPKTYQQISPLVRQEIIRILEQSEKRLDEMIRRIRCV